MNVKDPVERSREPIYNPATKYNAYVKPPEPMREPLAALLPTVKPNETSMKFSMIKSGGFTKSQTMN